MRCIRRSQVSGLLVARGRLLPRRIPLFIFYIYLLLAVSACSLNGKGNGLKGAAGPPAATEKNKSAESIAPIAPTPSPMDTFRALAPPEGLSFTPLFNEPVKDSDARMKRLEDAVQTIRNDFDTVVPTMVRMVAIEKDIKGLVAQLQTLTDGGQLAAQPVPAVTPQELPPAVADDKKIPPADAGKPIPGEDVAKGTEPAKAATAEAGPVAPSSLVAPEAAPKGELPPEGAASPSSNTPVDIKPQAQPAPAAETKPAAPPTEKTEAAAPQPSASTGGDVTGIRIADHPDKTRVVLDMTAKSAGAVKLENNGKTLVIDLSQMNWLGKKSWDADTAQLISGYHMEEGNLHVDLMYASQIKNQSTLLPSGNNKSYRLVIDLFSPEVHK